MTVFLLIIKRVVMTFESIYFIAQYFFNDWEIEVSWYLTILGELVIDRYTIILKIY